MTNGCEVGAGASEAVAMTLGCEIGLDAELTVYWTPNTPNTPNTKMRAQATTRTPTTTRPRTIGRMGPLDEAAGADVPQAALLS